MTTIPFIDATFLAEGDTELALFARLRDFLVDLRIQKREQENDTSSLDAEDLAESVAIGFLEHTREDELLDLTRSDKAKLERRAHALYQRKLARTNLMHLSKDVRKQLDVFRDGVPLLSIPSLARADEIAAQLHEEMPWMRAATEQVWYDMRRSVLEGAPGLRIRPLLLDGPPGVGKSHWARRLGTLIGTPSTVIEATSENAGFGVVGSQRGWSSSHPGRLLQTIMSNLVANPGDRHRRDRESGCGEIRGQHQPQSGAGAVALV